MVEFDFKRSARQCHVTDQPLGRGAVYFSVLTEGDDGLLRRKDISESAWQGPPADCVGWWRSRVPDLDKGRVYWAPNDVLLAYFQYLAPIPAQADLTYVVALVLIRKRLLQWKENVVRDGQTHLKLVDPKTNSNYEVAEFEIGLNRMNEIQAELAEKLFTDQREPSDESGDTAAPMDNESAHHG